MKERLVKTPAILKVRSRVCAGNVTVYGSPQCGWTKKQIKNFDEKGIRYKFVDCTKGKCPKIADGYPTTVISGFNKF